MNETIFFPVTRLQNCALESLFHRYSTFLTRHPEYWSTRSRDHKTFLTTSLMIFWNKIVTGRSRVNRRAHSGGIVTLCVRCIKKKRKSPRISNFNDIFFRVSAQKARIVHNEGHPGPVHGGRVQRRRQQHGAVRTVDEELAVLGRRHHRADGVRLRLRRQVRRLGRFAVARRAETRGHHTRGFSCTRP